jgi:2-phosphoglycerate kinase
MVVPRDPPPWTVTLVCGASGVGKSTVARLLAARYGVPLAEADDLVTGIKAVTTAEQQPVLHYWDTHPEAAGWEPERIADLHLAVAEALRPAFRAVIADHVEGPAPVLLEGDYLVPDLVGGFGGAVRAVVVSEPVADQVVANYRAREPGSGVPRGRALISALVERRLAERAADAGVPVVAARPWADAVDRIDRALRAGNQLDNPI